MLAAAVVALASCTSGGGESSPPPRDSLVTGRIAFDRIDGIANYEGSYLGTFIANADGSDEHLLPIPTGWSGPMSPVWSPDGNELVVNLWREPNGPGRAAVVHPDGSGFRVVGPGKLDASMGCSGWSPDGSTLLCSVDSRHHELNGIYSIGADGTGLTRLTRSPFHDTLGSAGECGGGDLQADYSPDGARIVFMRKRCGTGPDPSSDEASALYVQNSDGTGLRRITEYGAARSHPGGSVRWSPDGTEIVFESQDLNLHLVSPNGSAMTDVNLPAGPAEGPAWSPDGRWIVFSLAPFEGEGYAHIYRAWPDGTHLTEVSNTPNSDFLVSWSRK
jgi:Tol biopolymer transport system component